jgi:hypothetical protein
MTESADVAGTDLAGTDVPGTDASGGATRPASSQQQDDIATAPPVPVAQERTDGPGDVAEFAARLDVDPERDGVKG